MISSFFVGCSVRQVSVVWGTSPPIFQGLTAWLLARMKGVRFLFEVRDLWPAFAVAVGVLKNPLLIQLSQGLERFLYRRCDLLVVNSPGFIEHVKARGAKQVVLIPNGVDPAMFNPASRGETFRQKIASEPCYIVLYAGAFGISNDLTVLLDSARQLLAHPEIQFVLVGDGKEKTSLQDYAMRLSLTNVSFQPPVPKNQMSEVLAASDACIAILKPLEMYKTTYPNKVFDYMAAGRPTLCCIDGVIRQVIEESRGGIYVSPGNADELSAAILKLSTDPVLTRQMGENARAYVENHFNREAFSAIMEEKLLSLDKQ